MALRARKFSEAFEKRASGATFSQNILPLTSRAWLESSFYAVFIYWRVFRNFLIFTKVFRHMILSYFMSFHTFITIRESYLIMSNVGRGSFGIKHKSEQSNEIKNVSEFINLSGLFE